MADRIAAIGLTQPQALDALCAHLALNGREPDLATLERVRITNGTVLLPDGTWLDTAPPYIWRMEVACRG